MKIPSLFFNLPNRILNRWLELRASIAWSINSWIRPADADSNWEQK